MRRLTLALICFFFGVFGIHRFLTGKIWTGILYIFTGGLFGIGVIVDFINMLLGNFTDINGKKLQDKL